MNFNKISKTKKAKDSYPSFDLFFSFYRNSRAKKEEEVKFTSWSIGDVFGSLPVPSFLLNAASFFPNS